MILAQVAQQVNQTGLLAELIRQAPTLTVLVLLVWLFLSHMQKEGERNRESLDNNSKVIAEHTKVLIEDRAKRT